MDVFVGFITPFPWSWAPYGWSLCNGAQLAIAQQQALYSLIGVTFGGNQTVFNLPNLQGRQIVGMGQRISGGTYAVGNAGGNESVTLTAAQAPLATHTHTAALSLTGLTATTTLNASTQAGGSGTPAAGAGLCAAPSGTGGANIYKSPAPTTDLVALGNLSTTVSGSGTVTVSPAGASGSSPVDVRNPYLALNFCIALNGLYPSRN